MNKKRVCFHKVHIDGKLVPDACGMIYKEESPGRLQGILIAKHIPNIATGYFFSLTATCLPGRVMKDICIFTNAIASIGPDRWMWVIDLWRKGHEPFGPERYYRNLPKPATTWGPSS